MKSVDKEGTEEETDFLLFATSWSLLHPSILLLFLQTTISPRLMESRRATCGPGTLKASAPPPPSFHICLWVHLMCCSSFLDPVHFHSPLLFTLHLLSDTQSVGLNNSLPLPCSTLSFKCSVSFIFHLSSVFSSSSHSFYFHFSVQKSLFYLHEEKKACFHPQPHVFSFMCSHLSRARSLSLWQPESCRESLFFNKLPSRFVGINSCMCTHKQSDSHSGRRSQSFCLSKRINTSVSEPPFIILLK